MDGTRVERKRPGAGKTPRITQPLSISEARTRLKPGSPGARGLTFEERLALFAHSLARDRAQALLEGLAPALREPAQAYLALLSGLPSSERQGRLASEFGTRIEAGQRLREVWMVAGPELRRELFSLLPPYHRTLFPDYVLEPRPEGVVVAAALRPFAERLVREATR